MIVIKKNDSWLMKQKRHSNRNRSSGKAENKTNAKVMQATIVITVNDET